MIVRAFRLTDKFGNAALKALFWSSHLVADYVTAFETGAASMVAIGLGGFLRALRTVINLLSTVGRAIWSVLVFVVGVVIALGQGSFSLGRAIRDHREAAAGAGGTLSLRRSTAAAEQTRLDRMVRRADELVDSVVLVEDPLKTRNRTLSALLVVLLAAVVMLLIWATTPEQVAPPVLPPPGAAVVTSPEVQFTPFATAIPSVTPRPEALQGGGSLVYSLRQNGNTDLWVSVIGTSQPLRVTNHPADERDPAWYPLGGPVIAYVSNRDGNWELYAQDVTTAVARRLTYTPGFEGSPSWSPDGQWLVYEAYNGDNLNIYITRLDGTEGPIQLTQNPAPDFEPVWSPTGREIAYVSLREGNKDIFILSLDDPTEALAINLTGTPTLNEEHPAWSPDGSAIAYSARADGLEVVYVKPVAAGSEAQVIDRGRAPTWSPEGTSLIYAYDQGPRTILVAGQYRTVGVTSQPVTAAGRADDPDWTGWKPAVGTPIAGLEPANAGPLYNETVNIQDVPPLYRPILLNGVEAPLAYLSDQVDGSFVALRQAVLTQTGVDYLGVLEDALWTPDRLPEPGQDRLNWHMTGRSFAINRNLIFSGFPVPLEVVREDIGISTYWRLYARTAVQDGQLGEPLRDLPWDFGARSQGDPQAYDEGGRLRSSVPAGYYVDLTQLFADYGWERVPADRSWRANFGGVLFWQFVRSDGLIWEEAMLELYSAEDLNTFLTVPTAFPTPTLAPPTPTPQPTRTPTPIPPDQPPPEAGASE